MKEKLLHERALVSCIAMLFICIILKLFGVQWFDLNTDIPILQEIDKVVINSVPLSFLYGLLFKCFNFYLLYVIVTRNTKINIISLISFVTISSIIKSYIGIFAFLLEIVILVIICKINAKTKNTIMNVIIVCFVSITYQMISLFIRNISIDVNCYNSLTVLLMNIDYYIMLIITYLWVKKGDKDLCGLMVASFSSLATKLWKKHSENYSNKEGN